MDLSYFKDRFNNTESAYLLARRANNPGLNPFALQAIEEIITERGEPLPPRNVEPIAEVQKVKESNTDKFWRLTALIAASIWLIVILNTYTTGFLQDRAATLVSSVVLSTWLLLWLRKKNMHSAKQALERFASQVINVFKSKIVAIQLNKRKFLGLPIGVIVMMISMSYFVMSPNVVSEPEHIETWYLYGLIFNKDFDDYQKKLAPYKIKLMSGGCIVGGDEYKKDMQNNRRVYESASEELKELLGKPKSHN